MSKSDDRFARDAKALFDASVDELDAATLSKLNRGRHRALDELGSARANWMRWAPAAGVAAAVVLAVTLTMRQPVDVEALPATVTDMEILLGEESIEMLEDLEFYSWLDTVESEGDVG